jgi:hypothetical protein
MGTEHGQRGSGRHHRPFWRWLGVIVILGAVTAACGSRRSEGDLMAAPRGGRAGSSALGAGDQSGAGGYPLRPEPGVMRSR